MAVPSSNPNAFSPIIIDDIDEASTRRKSEPISKSPSLSSSSSSTSSSSSSSSSPSSSSSFSSSSSSSSSAVLQFNPIRIKMTTTSQLLLTPINICDDDEEESTHKSEESLKLSTSAGQQINLKRFQNDHKCTPSTKRIKLDLSQSYFSPQNVLTHISSYNGEQPTPNDKSDGLLFNHWRYTDYANEILEVLRLRERERKTFFYHAPQAEYRLHFVHFIRKVALAEELYRSTVHLAIYILDTFMDNHQIGCDRLRLVALCSLLLAAKIEDHDPKIPKIKDLNTGIDNQYKLSDYTALERLILKFFDFKLLIPTAATFVEIFIEEICNEDDFQMTILLLSTSPNNNSYQFSNLLNMKRSLIESALDMLDLTLFDTNMVQELPSRMASACLAAARQIAQLKIIWPEYLQKITQYKFKDIENCVTKLINLSKNKNNQMVRTLITSTGDFTDNNINPPLTIDIAYHSCTYKLNDSVCTPPSSADTQSFITYDSDDSIEIE